MAHHLKMHVTIMVRTMKSTVNQITTHHLQLIETLEQMIDKLVVVADKEEIIILLHRQPDGIQRPNLLLKILVQKTVIQLMKLIQILVPMNLSLLMQTVVLNQQQAMLLPWTMVLLLYS